MEEAIIKVSELSIWSGIAAVGFGILFNIPRKTILVVFFLGLAAGLVKFFLIDLNINIVLSTLVAASFVGILSSPLAHKVHHPPVVFSIPAVIPMIPGYYAYETVLSIMSFTFMEKDPQKRMELMASIFFNGFTTIFILIAITIGVSLPLLLSRKETVKKNDGK
ncbi:threonine/serine exporter family protein [Maribacter sp. TH_r10]|uniref:Threonine/serine exporter n=1 Tax=Maribacter luteus TaxID=2594478 RepID=A0A6I2MK83_9FLAO|nr:MULTISPECIES: threonine/serine exporter family protein [Maribacter]MDV7137871.1 threonine/serine exporter family protein [Maribacter sp. TH_r10]MRX62970.1 threonine/serine exporter [Maribacter luteus]